MHIKHLFGTWYDFERHGWVDLSKIFYVSDGSVIRSDDGQRAHYYFSMYTTVNRVDIDSGYKESNVINEEFKDVMALLLKIMETVHSHPQPVVPEKTREPNNPDIEIA